jgi:hypothetical protein
VHALAPASMIDLIVFVVSDALLHSVQWSSAPPIGLLKSALGSARSTPHGPPPPPWSRIRVFADFVMHFELICGDALLPRSICTEGELSQAQQTGLCCNVLARIWLTSSPLLNENKRIIINRCPIYLITTQHVNVGRFKFGSNR